MAHNPSGPDDRYAGHERQVNRRNFSDANVKDDGYNSVPPGEYGQYGMRREDSPAQPWYNETKGRGHSVNENDASYTRWLQEHLAQCDVDYRNWMKEKHVNFSRDFEEWRHKQTSPGSNVGIVSAAADGAKDE